MSLCEPSPTYMGYRRTYLLSHVTDGFMAKVPPSGSAAGEQGEGECCGKSRERAHRVLNML